MRRLDVAVAVWVFVWAVLGLLVWHDVRAQSLLSGDIVKVGKAVEDTGQALGVVGGLPLVGGGIAGFADKIETTGAEVVANGRSSYRGMRRVAVISGIGVGVLPAALVLMLYLPPRLAWRRDVHAVRDTLPASAGDPVFEGYLARRALAMLPWDRLREVSDDPWHDVANGDFRRLADVELARLGIQRPG